MGASPSDQRREDARLQVDGLITAGESPRRDDSLGATRRVATGVAPKDCRPLSLRNVLLQSSAVARTISLSYDEAMAVCLLLAEAADASVNEEPVRDTWVEEARLMVELILSRTDE